MRVSGFLVLMVGLGVVGVTWMLVDVVNLGWSHVPGSTWVCGVLGLVLALTAFYRELGGRPLLTEDPDHQNPAQQYEAQKKHDGLS